ncbi:MAG: hypothetical protein QNI92_12550 [Desulfobacterales bacterium]|nr:hypothetical protein [Desulfobacterales bacterium]
MADIILIDDKIKAAETKRAAQIRKKKLLAVQRVLQCSQCAFKCEKCGSQIKMADQEDLTDDGPPRFPYRFCESCDEEYRQYIRHLEGHADPDCYWHNDSWLDAWKKWIDYQGAFDSYLKSKEFIQLLQELKQIRFEE